MNKYNITVTNPFASIFFALFWVTGWVLASGFWSTFFAFIFPPWGWYLIVSTALTYWGVI